MSIRLPDFSALIQNHHLAKQSANIALYEPKAQVYFQLKKYLAHPFSYRTAYERVIDITPTLCPLSQEDIERLEFDIEHLFSDNVYVRFTELSAILEELHNINFDLNELFDAIKSDKPEWYIQVRDALLDDECTKESEEVLDDLEITFLNQEPWQNRKVYNYQELEKEYMEKQEQYIAGVSAILDEMEEEIERC